MGEIVKAWAFVSVLAVVFGVHVALADSFEIVKNGQAYTCTSNGGSGDGSSCAEASIKKMGYVTSDCLKLDAGGRCAVASLDKMGYITSDCQNVQNSRQDR